MEFLNKKFCSRLYNTIKLKSTLQSSGNTSYDICFVVRKVIFILVASNLRFEMFYETSLFLFYCSDLVTFLISLPNTFLEKEVISPEK